MTYKEIKVLDLCALDASAMDDLMGQCPDGEHKVMDEHTLCLFDLSPYQFSDYQSLLIQNTGDVYKSRLTTNQLLQQFAGSLNNEQCFTNAVAQTLDIHKKVPYVIGERGIIPLDGYSKKPVTWIVSNHAKRATYDTAQNRLSLKTHKGFVLAVNASEAMFEAQLTRTVRIMRQKWLMFSSHLKEYPYFYRVPGLIPQNILSQRYQQVVEEEPALTFFEAKRQVVENEKNKAIKKLLGEGNPYYEDYLEQAEN